MSIKVKLTREEVESASWDGDAVDLCADWLEMHAEIDRLRADLARAQRWSKRWKRYAKSWHIQVRFLFEKPSLGAQIRNFFLYKAALKQLGHAVEALREIATYGKSRDVDVSKMAADALAALAAASDPKTGGG